jgi:hypothetical protein
MSMDHRTSIRIGPPKGGRNLVSDRAPDGVRRLRNKNGKLVDIGEALVRSHVTVLHGRPFPVQWRSQGAKDAWAQAMGDTEVWRQWGAPGMTYSDIRREIMWQVERSSPPLESGESLARRVDEQSLIAVEISTNLMYCRHQGTVIEATPALESLLANSDIDLGLPMSMFAPPYAAQYLHFGEQAMRHLAAPNARLPGHVFDGVFCFFTPSAHPGALGVWVLELVFISKRDDRFNGQITLIGTTDRGNMRVGEWLDSVLGTPAGPSSDKSRPAMHAAVSYVVKLFLYMGLKHARRVEHKDLDDALRRAEGLGERKRDKLLKRAASLYNAIVVGPETVAAQAASCGAGASIAPHWRRGHFRMQPHGPGWQERKLIFVAPVLIHAKQLQGGVPAPKAYCADA